MRILLSCLQDLKRHDIPAYRFWASYFKNGIAEAGHEWIEVPGVDWAEGLTYPAGADLVAWRARTWERVLEFVRNSAQREPLDFFLGYLFPGQVEPAAIIELQRIGLPCVNFFCDNVREFSDVPEVYRPFALHWVPEFEALPMYRRAGLPHLHAPMPCWVPSRWRDVPENETEPPTFIGSADILRRDLLGRALQAGAELIIRGPGWGTDSNSPLAEPQTLASRYRNQIETLRMRGYRTLARKIGNRLRPIRPPPIPTSAIRASIWNDEYARVTREAVVTIGVNRVPANRASLRQPLTYSRLRDIEAPMMGACYLTEWTAGLDSLYESGKDIETYRDAEELAENLQTLRRDPIRRQALRESAQRRALKEHSVPSSLRAITRSLGLSP